MSNRYRKTGTPNFATKRILDNGYSVTDSRGNEYRAVPTSVSVDFKGNPVGRNYTLVKVYSNK